MRDTVNEKVIAGTLANDPLVGHGGVLEAHFSVKLV